MKLLTDLAIDLGSQNIRIISSANETIINEPSLVAIENEKIVAVGEDAKHLQTSTNEDMKVISPIVNGIITDIPFAKGMIEYFVKKSMGKYSVGKPRVLVLIPFGLKETQRRLIREIFLQKVAEKCLLVEQPMVLAPGCGIDISYPNHTSSLIVDIGVNSARVAIISLGSLVSSETFSKDNVTEELKKFIANMDIEFIDEMNEKGITLTGGGALTPNLASELESELKLKVQVAKDPEISVILGGRYALKEIDLLCELLCDEEEI